MSIVQNNVKHKCHHKLEQIHKQTYNIGELKNDNSNKNVNWLNVNHKWHTIQKPNTILNPLN